MVWVVGALWAPSDGRRLTSADSEAPLPGGALSRLWPRRVWGPAFTERVVVSNLLVEIFL